MFVFRQKHAHEVYKWEAEEYKYEQWNQYWNDDFEMIDGSRRVDGTVKPNE